MDLLHERVNVLSRGEEWGEFEIDDFDDVGEVLRAKAQHPERRASASAWGYLKLAEIPGPYEVVEISVWKSQEAFLSKCSPDAAVCCIPHGVLMTGQFRLRMEPNPNVLIVYFLKLLK